MYMLAILIIAVFCVYLIFFLPEIKAKNEPAITDPKAASQLKKLWQIAQASMKERKPLRAEKALLTILKFDEKNAAAYNRLGILYAKENQYSEAIECFEIAQSLDSNASCLHNAGLIYLETGVYEKASQAFKQAIELEGDLPARYIAYSKSEEKLGNYKNALEALETAFELDRSTTILRHILSLHENANNQEGIIATQARIESLLAEQKEKTITLTAHKKPTKPQKEAKKHPKHHPFRPRKKVI
jgi:tetratricopeptide (TPR) repeat protein